MMQELAEELRDRGHTVTVATAMPHNDLNLSQEERRRRFDTFSIEDAIRVIRVYTPPLKSRFYFLRGIVQLLLPYFFMKQIRKYVTKEIDSVIISTPPLPLTLLGCMVKKIYGSKYILCVQDIFPQNVIDLGIMKNKAAIKFFEFIEKMAYRCCDVMTSHTLSSRNFLIEEKNTPSDKIYYIPNWINISQYRNAERTGRYRKRYHLEDKFIFLFAGVIGPSQGLDLVLKAVAHAKNMPDDICILIIGEGSEKDKLVAFKNEYNLHNVVFAFFVSLEEYPWLVKDVDVGLVCLSSRNKTPVIPGKVLGYMASSVPIVAFLNRESDGHQVITEAGCGYSTASDASLEAISSVMIEMYAQRDKLAGFGENGFKYVLNHFTKKVCIEHLIQLL